MATIRLIFRLSFAFAVAVQHLDVVQTQAGCDQQFDSSGQQWGTFSSPNYPNNAPSQAQCRYSFRSRGSERVQIRFIDFDLREDDSGARFCDDDADSRVEVETGGNVIGRFCGGRLPPMMMSAGYSDGLDVTFTSHPQHPARGFAANFSFVTDFGIKYGEQVTGDISEVCQFMFGSDSGTSGNFSSPNFPGLYPRNTVCHYLFYAGEDHRIHISFPVFDVEGIPPQCSDSTMSDYVEFSDFNIGIVDRQMQRLCGIHPPTRRVVSDDRFFRVSFHSNDVYDTIGFLGHYEFRRN